MIKQNLYWGGYSSWPPIEGEYAASWTAKGGARLARFKTLVLGPIETSGHIFLVPKGMVRKNEEDRFPAVI